MKSDQEGVKKRRKALETPNVSDSCLWQEETL